MTKKIFTMTKITNEHQLYKYTYPNHPSLQYTASKIFTMESPLAIQNKVDNVALQVSNKRNFPPNIIVPHNTYPKSTGRMEIKKYNTRGAAFSRTAKRRKVWLSSPPMTDVSASSKAVASIF